MVYEYFVYPTRATAFFNVFSFDALIINVWKRDILDLRLNFLCWNGFINVMEGPSRIFISSISDVDIKEYSMRYCYGLRSIGATFVFDITNVE